MYEGSLPSTSIYNTWLENVEITSADDEGLVDLSSLTEITLRVVDPISMLDELVLTMSNGDITIPSLGIIQWRAEQTQMATLPAKLYKVILLLTDPSNINVIILGTLSVVD